MAEHPSPLYFLLTSPAGWTTTPRGAGVIAALSSRAWDFDPSETPPGRRPLPEAMVAAFGAMSRFGMSPAVDATFLSERAWDFGSSETSFQTASSVDMTFQAAMLAVFAAGGRLDSSFSARGLPSSLGQWLTAVTLENGAGAEDLARAYTAVDLLQNTPNPVRELKQWCDTNGVGLNSSLAGVPLLAHLTAGACRAALEWGNRHTPLTDQRLGWLEVDHEGISVTSNRSAAHRRIAHVGAFHRWVHLDQSPSPLDRALWWLMAWPLAIQRGGRPVLNTDPAKLHGLRKCFHEATQHPDLVPGLQEVIALSSCSPLRRRLGAMVLAALQDLSADVPQEKVWGLLADALDTQPMTARRWNVESGAADPSCRHVVVAIGAVVAQKGFPSAAWAVAQTPPVSQAILTEVWGDALVCGVFPSEEQGAWWYTVARTDPGVRWPSLDALKAWSYAKNSDFSQNLLGWLDRSHQLAEAQQRQERLRERTPAANLPPPRPRM